MSEPFVGQLMLAGFNFAPRGWALCAGQLMSISQNTALFSLLGTYYGGDGKTTFGLPNLQGNCAVGFGQGPGLSQYDIGQIGGSQTVTLNTSQVPSHNHVVNGGAIRADASAPGGNAFAQSGAGNIYNNTAGASTVQMSPNTLPGPVGGSQPHNNMMPYLTLNWVIALQGIYPSRS